MSAVPEVKPFEDYYELLQLSPNADDETISRVYRILVRRYHPDNQETGNPEKFTQIVKAYKTLSDPEARTAYDVGYEENRASVLKIFDETSSPESYDGDRRIFEGVLSLLYISRRRDPSRGGMGVIQMETLLGCPAKHLEFHLWYLREKGFVERLENGLLAITANGIDRVMEQESLFMRRDRLLAERSSSAPGELKSNND
jgi:curved DNA-binding protein CbpA